MIDLRKTSTAEPGNLYVIRVRESEVGVTGDPYFWFVSPFGALSKDFPDPSINMIQEKNNYTDPHLQLTGNSATLRDLSGETIHLEW